MQDGETKDGKEGVFVDGVFELGRVVENGINRAQRFPLGRGYHVNSLF